MANKKQTVTVEQLPNIKFNPEQPEDQITNPRFVYGVVKTLNTLRVAIRQQLTPGQVQDLMDVHDIDVTVIQAK